MSLLSDKKQTTKRTAPSTAWKPGVSGNPTGRPKETPELHEIRLLARGHAPEAIRRLAALIHSPHEQVSLRAADLVLTRGYGPAAPAAEPIGENAPVLITFKNDRNLQVRCSECEKTLDASPPPDDGVIDAPTASWSRDGP